MTKSELEYEFSMALNLLDACTPALEAAKAAEARREAGKTLRCITWQERLETVRELLNKHSKLLFD